MAEKESSPTLRFLGVVSLLVGIVSGLITIGEKLFPSNDGAGLERAKRERDDARRKLDDAREERERAAERRGQR